MPRFCAQFNALLINILASYIKKNYPIIWYF